MRILFVHNRYQQRGGEDRVVEAESRLLARMGHAIDLLEENNDSIVSGFEACKTALQSVYSIPHANAVRARIRRFRPDVVHVHNFFPRLSPSIHWTCRGAGVPVVQTLHNYRLLCPSAALHGKDGVCEACVCESVPWPALVNGCYRNSHLATLAVANLLSVHRVLGTWDRCVSRFIALTEFARRKFVDGGLPGGRVVVKPNFADQDPGIGRGGGNYALFVGRLVQEKGILPMLGAWRLLGQGPKLRIIGDGPLASAVAQATATNPRIEWLGSRSQEEVRQAMAEATVLILPSTWYEAFPMVVTEAFAAGLPIIASRLGAMEELVQDGQTGRLFTAGNHHQLAAVVRSVFTHPLGLQGMRLRARAEYEGKYTGEANYTRMIGIYEAAMGSHPISTRMTSRLEAIG